MSDVAGERPLPLFCPSLTTDVAGERLAAFFITPHARGRPQQRRCHGTPSSVALPSQTPWTTHRTQSPWSCAHSGQRRRGAVCIWRWTHCKRRRIVTNVNKTIICGRGRTKFCTGSVWYEKFTGSFSAQVLFRHRFFFGTGSFFGTVSYQISSSPSSSSSSSSSSCARCRPCAPGTRGIAPAPVGLGP